jgi:hypothetical protein
MNKRANFQVKRSVADEFDKLAVTLNNSRGGTVEWLVIHSMNIINRDGLNKFMELSLKPNKK